MRANVQIIKGKIYLGKPLLDKLQPREVLAVLCNEIGHLKYKHKYWSALLVDLFYVTIFAFVFDHVLKNNASFQVVLGFKADDDISLFLRLVIFCHVFSSTIDPLLRIWINWFLKRQEHKADALAVELKFANELKSSLVNLAANDLDNFF